MERIICNTVVLKEVAQELGLPVSIVKEVVETQSQFTKLTMESGSFDSVRWPYLGVFKSKPKEVQMINHLQGMTKEQADEFKKNVRTGRIKLNHWEDKLKQKKNASKLQRSVGTDNTVQTQE